MLIPKNLIAEAKEKLGERAAQIIAEDLKIEDWDEKILKGKCPFHNEDTGSFIWNGKPNDNYFKCFGCSKVYSIVDHFMGFYNLTFIGAIEKLFNEVDIKYRFNEKGIKTHKDYRYPYREQAESRKISEEYLAKRKISIKTLDYTDTQEDSSGNIVFHFYDLNDVLTLVKYRPSRKVNKGENKSWSQVNADTKPLLFNINRIDSTKPLVITEGEIDCLSVIEAGYLNCVSVPFGSSNYGWIEENWDFLQQFEKIIIWADNDESGLKMRKECGSRLGTWRTYFVDLPNKVGDENGESHSVKDANEVLYFFGKEKVIDYLNNAQEIPVTGIIDLADVEDFDLEKAIGLYTHLAPLDNLVYKFLFGSVILLTGVKGSGKSTFLNQIFVCESLDQGYDVFLYSAELSSPVAKSWIELTMAGPEFAIMKENSKFIRKMNPEIRKQMREWYKERIYVYDDLSNKADDILDKAITVVRKYGVKTVILDNLMTIDLGASDNNYLQKQKDLIVKLVSLAKQYGILILLVAHPRKTMVGMDLTSDDISGASELGNLAQYIASVHRYTEKEKNGEMDSKGNYKKGREPIPYDVAVDVMKNRYTGKIGRANLYFDYPSYRFYSKPDEIWKRYGWDKRDKNKFPLRKDDPNEHTLLPEAMKD